MRPSAAATANRPAPPTTSTILLTSLARPLRRMSRQQCHSNPRKKVSTASAINTDNLPPVSANHSQRTITMPLCETGSSERTPGRARRKRKRELFLQYSIVSTKHLLLTPVSFPDQQIRMNAAFLVSSCTTSISELFFKDHCTQTKIHRATSIIHQHEIKDKSRLNLGTSST